MSSESKLSENVEIEKKTFIETVSRSEGVSGDAQNAFVPVDRAYSVNTNA